MKTISLKKIPPMYEHQIQAKEFISDKSCFALFMEQGTGKSKVAIEKSSLLYMQDKIDAVIIISPNAVKSQWIEEQYEEHCIIKEWNGIEWNGGKTKKFKNEFEKYVSDKNKLFVFSTNVEAFQSDTIDLYIKYILDNRKVFVIIDESTKIKNGRRKPVRGKRGGAKRTNKILDMFAGVEYKTILTGTPTPNNPFDLWSQFEFLQKNFFGMDYFYFEHHYGIMIQKSTNEGRRYFTVLDEKTFSFIKNRLKKEEKLTNQKLQEISIQFGMKTKDILQVRRMDEFASYKNLPELKDKIKEITFFVKKEDCLDLPDKVYEKLYCDLSKEQKKIYEEIKKDMYSEYQGKEINIVNKVVMYLRLQMVTGGLFPYAETTIKVNSDGDEFFDSTFEYEYIESNNKIKVLLEDLETVPKETFIIIWARFRGEIDLITEKVSQAGYTCEKYYGGSSYEIIERFKKKEFQILIASTLKGGEGLNLQLSTLQYFYSNSHKADSRLQAEDRSHRIGQTNKVLYKDIICKNTVDVRIYEVLKRKENLINYFRTNPDNFLED